MMTSCEETPQEWARRRVEESAIPEPNTGCLLWEGASQCGYGTGTYQGKNTRITRALLGLPRLRRGERNSDTVVACHHCDTPACVNEAHLFKGTPSDNAWDAIRKGRWAWALAARSHCLQGHALTPDNLLATRPNKPNKIGCKACRRARAIRLRASRAKPRPEHCPSGHAYADHGVLWSGKRRCATCHKAARAAREAR